jgi:hypothetical protein
MLIQIRNNAQFDLVKINLINYTETGHLSGDFLLLNIFGGP